MTINRILQQLLAETPSIEHLQCRLIESAEKLNKPDKYIQLANTIVETLRKSLGRNQAHAPKSDRFKLRFAIMQVMNPYKAKAVLLALYSQKAPAGSAELRLRSFSIDELLRKVFQYYPDVQTLEQGLRSVQSIPGGVLEEEREQLLQTLLEALRPHLGQGREPLEIAAIAPDLMDEMDQAMDSESLCTILVAPEKLKAAAQAS